MFTFSLKTLSDRLGLRDDRGSMAIMSAAFITVGLGVAAIAVDAGALFTERRTLQGATDLAAIAAASNIDRAEAAVNATLQANGITASYSIERGQYAPDAKIPVNERFKPGVAPYNAVRVNVVKPGQLYFARSFTDKTFEIGVTSTAANAALAAFSIGSRLLAVRDGIANKILGGLTGSEISLSVMDYEGLAKADIKLAQFTDALASRLNITAGTYDDVLNSSASLGNVINAAADVTEKSGQASATATLKSFLTQSGSLTQTVPLDALINAGPLGSTAIGDPAPGLDATLSALDIVSAAAVLANGTRQVQLDLTASVPGVASLKLDLAIGEPPQKSASTAVGQPSARVRTAQTRLRLTAEVGGVGALAGIKVRLPLYLDLAYGEARLASIDCAAGSEPKAVVAARSGVAELWIGRVNDDAFTDFSGKPSVTLASLVSAPLVRIDGQAHVDVGSTSETMLEFDNTDVANGTIKRTSTQNPAESLVTSLLADADLKVRLLGLGIAAPGAVTKALADTLAPVLKPIDALLTDLLATLGVHLGEADVRVHGIRCGGGALAG